MARCEKSLSEKKVEYICLICQKKFKDYKSNYRKFCSIKCYHKFKEGKTSWNKGKTYSVLDRFKIGIITVRIDKYNKKRNWIKIAHPSKWTQLSHYIWEKYTGYNPYNQIIHHKDFNSLNDKFLNLEIVSRKKHIEIHRIAYNHCRKKIKQYSRMGKFLRIWPSMMEAANAVGVCPSAITNSINGRRPTAGGYKWAYY